MENEHTSSIPVSVGANDAFVEDDDPFGGSILRLPSEIDFLRPSLIVREFVTTGITSFLFLILISFKIYTIDGIDGYNYMNK